MSSKTIFGILVVIALVLAGIYFSGKEKAVAPVSDTTAQSSVTVPAKDSSSDEIIDYVVDGLSTDEEMTTKSSLESSSVPSQSEAASTLNTNF